MNWLCFSSSLPPLLFCLICIMPAFPVSCSSPELYKNCHEAEFKCGKLYAGNPFHGGDRKSECGHPGLELRCDNDTNTTTIEIVGVNYVVMEIEHERHILRIQREDFINGGFCNTHTPIKSSMIDHELFDVGPEYTYLTLFYDCPSPISSTLLQLPCNSLSHYKNITVTTQNVPPRGCVTNLTLPVHRASLEKYFKNHSVDLAMEEARKGLEVKWKDWEQEACRNCSASGGVCGFEWNETICYCPYGFKDWTLQYPNQCYPPPSPETRKGSEVKWRDWEQEACQNCSASGGACGLDEWNQPICYCPHGFKSWMAQHPKQCHPFHHPAVNKKHANNGLRLGLGIAGGAAIAISLVGIVLVSIARFTVLRFKGKSLSNHLSQGKINYNARIEAFITKFDSFAPNRYSYGEIKKMTNKFKDKLGQGGFGSVYKGELPDGRLVAVKVLSETKGNGEDFMNEVASISRTSHVNIVCLLGFCFGRTKRALIYEFLSHGSLDKFIYSRQLDWKTLYDIALGIARGLEYLHQGCSTRILHFDIKPHNILLDEDFCPKIADFGLSKLCERKESVISMTGARGTAGYIAPEVFSRHLGGVSHKSDVYSYGMMVLEMIGGRRNIEAEASQTSEIYYPSWIYKHLDQCMNLDLDEEITGEEGEIKKKLIAVSLCCIQTNPVDRPSITKVLEMLQGSLQSLILPPRPP